MVDAARLRDELRRMRTLIQNDPGVKARFDKDGNGEIDGDEWEEVRRLVTQRLEREEAENAERARLVDEMESAGEPVELGVAGAPTAGAVAQGIYDGELHRHADAAAAATGGSLGDFDELIVQQEGGAKQLFGNAFRREYSILAPNGSAIGAIQQRENEMLQEATNRSLLEVPDLHFDVFDALTQNRYVLKRTEGVARQRMGILDERGMVLAYTAWKFHLVWKKYDVVSALDGSKLLVQNQLTRPFTLQILDVMEEPVGAIERGFSGLGGLLSGGNKMRIHVRSGEANPGLRLGLIAATVLTDLAQDQDRARAKGVFKL